jgi:HD-GYP domain-containing protein (c-di-GMP phosphodiesterase class II)
MDAVHPDSPPVSVVTGAVPGLRRIPKTATGQAAAALLQALAVDGDRLSAVLGVTATLAGAPATVVWRLDDRGRLLLARRFGDAAVAAQSGSGLASGDGDDAGGGGEGVPLEIYARPEGGVGVIQLHGRPFAAVAIEDGLLALGPLQRERLTPRSRRRLATLGGLVSDAIREALRSTALEREVEGLRREVDLARRSLGSTIDQDRSLFLLLDLAVTSSGSRGGFIAVRRGERFTITASRELPEAFADLDVTPGHGVLAQIPGLPGLLVVDDPDRLTAAGVGGLLAVAGGSDAEHPTLIFGLVADDDSELPPDCARMLTTLIESAGLVIESAGAARLTADRHVAALRGLCHALDARSVATDGHHARVARVATALAQVLGVDEELKRLVADAALVHDAGLLAATPAEALGAEFGHPSLGAEMVGLVPGAVDLAPLIRGHHEWWDGFGFPNGLQGDSIPFGARILGAAEFYVETLQSSDHRWTPDLLADEVRARRGTHLDPACADSLVTLISSHGV